MPEVSNLRQAMLAAPMESSNFGEEPRPETLYAPLSHLKALRLDAHVVVGGRGVGKSFWTAALQSKDLRATLGAVMPNLEGVEIKVGFGTREAIDDFPNADTFSLLMDEGHDPYDIWRAVIVRWIGFRTQQSLPSQSWHDTVNWLKGNPEQAARLMQKDRDWRGLIVFDALDRTSTDWKRMDEIVRGLLRASLWLKSYPELYAKAFLREDQAERTVFNFPDASKLLATRAELTWARHDLHGLLWQRLINATDGHGEIIRSHLKTIIGDKLNEREKNWQLPEVMKRDSDEQRKAFEQLAGPWMGRDRRRGVPYSWAVSHLADGRGQTSPRSFLAAIKQAVEDTIERYPQHDYALHYESIKRGIQEASEIRVAEVAEDYPWVTDVLSTLRGVNVPCDLDVVNAKWDERFPNGPTEISTQRLPAQHADRGWDGISGDLQRLGMIEFKKDGRLDLPDLYRVGFGLGRKGGVKPRSS